MTTITDICPMHLVLTAATAGEIQPAIDWLANKNNSGPFPKVDILITGVGSVATTYFLTYYLGNANPGIIIQGGIAGSFQPHFNGETVVIGQDCFADMGAWENEQFKDIFDLKLIEENQPPFTNRVLINPYGKLLAITGLKQVSGVTVNEITTDSRRIAWYQQNLSPVVESMEGAAFHYVCHQKNILFLQLRSISNDIGERDKAKWNLAEAIRNLNEQLISLLNKLSQYDETYFRV
jgi:futalosine hydrolase